MPLKQPNQTNPSVCLSLHHSKAAKNVCQIFCGYSLHIFNWLVSENLKDFKFIASLIYIMNIILINFAKLDPHFVSILCAKLDFHFVSILLAELLV